MMRMIIVVGTAAFAAMPFSSDPAKAAEAPWCAVTNTGIDMHWDCQYRSAQECAPHVIAGNRGFCNHNPYYVSQPPERRAQRRRPT